MLNIIDIAIVIIILFGAVIGFKRGFTKQLVSAIGFILVVVLAFNLKNSVSVLLYQNLPFFSFKGIFQGVTVLNIALYEFIAFLVVLAILMVILRLILMATGLLETVFNLTIILGIISKFLGAIVGAVEYFVIVFICLYALTIPIFNFDMVQNSKYKDKILNNTSVLSKYVDKSVVVLEEFRDLKDKYKDNTNPNQFNLEALDLFLKYNVISIASVDKLIEKNKLQIDNVESVLQKYRKDD
jgi:uncharacterized membrane protein required for colicin V production